MNMKKLGLAVLIAGISATTFASEKQESIATRINKECTKQVIVQYRPNGQNDISGFESFGFAPHDIQHEKEVALEDVQRAIVERDTIKLSVTEGRCLVQIDYKE
ncbi:MULTISPECIES: hypothetical protein [Burkholderiaceae]|uniref:hypothetical protein n=1 Tax=Burkholderiaceae TaxID=119060 RepID=UPI001C96E58D|nr:MULTISPECIES: hypothetical protein [Burkholderiaceae]MBY4717538.1 hypothetical protein [Ralstonia mannitolilytica]MCW5156390.1 hypothetical protein [Burkholderia cenocepacia]